MGKCPTCNEWNTLVEEALPSGKSKALHNSSIEKNTPEILADINPEKAARIVSSLVELDRVLGGGFVIGSSVLIGGDPGVGKSTLLLQAAASMAGGGNGVLYITAEEASAQIRLRSDRLDLDCKDFQVLAEADVDLCLEWARKMEPAFVIVDSVQTCRTSDFDSAPGTVTQVREVASRWSDYARQSGAAVALVGHVTKEGAIAGPRVIEHLVDAVMMFEGDNLGSVRMLRALKNRYGATGELGVFEMTSQGLKGVSDPSRRFIGQRSNGVSGVAVASTVRGSRPMLIEVQALVTTSLYPAPQRNSTGIDPRRLAMWIAVLEKRVGLGLAGRDVFINATGGLKLDDSAADLAAAAAINSSLRDVPVNPETVLIGEIGLTGEVRAVSAMDRRLSEASHMAFKRAIIPDAYKDDIPKGIKVIRVKTLEDALEASI